MNQQATSQPKTEKKPYEKPAVIHRQTLEAVAGVCDTNIGGKEDSGCSAFLMS